MSDNKVPEWARLLSDKLDQLFPEDEDSDTPSWAQSLLDKLDELSGEPAEESETPKWVETVNERLDALLGTSTTPKQKGQSKKVPAAPTRRRTTVSPSTQPQRRSRWFGNAS